MTPSTYTHVVFAERPKGAIDASTFSIVDAPFDLKPADDEALVKVEYLSLDPAMRIWLDETRTYMHPIAAGDTMGAIGLGTVIEAGSNSGVSVGDQVSGMVGMKNYSVLKGKDLTKIVLPENAQTLDFLGPLGHPGLTAYQGIIDVGNVKAGEAVVVSGAAGAVGSMACILAKDKGAKVYGTAGSDEKCRYLEQEIGVVKAFNYKSPTFQEDFIREVGTFNLLFDNVGGEFLDFALTRMSLHARVLCCGFISRYNGESYAYKNLPEVLSKRAKIEGFSLLEYGDRTEAARKVLAEKVAQGIVKYRYHILDGLKEAPLGINMLFRGENRGKLVVKVSH